jgi:hypothetical protein
MGKAEVVAEGSEYGAQGTGRRAGRQKADCGRRIAEGSKVQVDFSNLSDKKTSLNKKHIRLINNEKSIL